MENGVRICKYSAGNEIKAHSSHAGTTRNQQVTHRAGVSSYILPRFSPLVYLICYMFITECFLIKKTKNKKKHWKTTETQIS